MAKKRALTFSINSRGYIYAVHYAKDGRVNTSIGLQVTKEVWDSKKLDRATSRRMDRLELLVEEYIQGRAAVDKPTVKADIMAIIDKELDRMPKTKLDNLVSYFTKYRDGIKNGDIDNKGKPYGVSTLRQVSALLTILTDNPAIGNIPLGDFSYDHYTALKQQFLKDKLAHNTINNYNINLIKFFKRTRKLKWHSNTWYIDEETTIGREDIDTHIYLTEKELAKLYATKTDNLWKEKTRDLFVFGCYIGLRHTDLSRLKNAILKDGVLHILAKKGGRTVHIPLNSIAREIWDKYHGDMPTRWNNTFNATIREICKSAGFTELCLYVRTKGAVKTEYHYPKYRMVGTHTMRRSFATNAYRAGVPVPAIMKITGHRTEISFFRYIRITNEENAEEMKLHAFFK